MFMDLQSRLENMEQDRDMHERKFEKLEAKVKDVIDVKDTW